MVHLAERKLEEVFNRLAQQKVRCVDVETSGLDWKRNSIVGYVLTFGPHAKDSYYLPFRHGGGGNLFDNPGLTSPTSEPIYHSAERRLIQALDQQDTLVFGHNIAFDLKFLWRAGMTRLLPRFEDTIIYAPLLDEWQAKFSLEYCANSAKVTAKKSVEITNYLCKLFPEAAKAPKSSMGHFWRLAGDDDMAVDYAEGDGISTWQLRDWQLPQLAAQDLTLVADIESRLIPVLVRMSCLGIKIDEKRLHWLSSHIDKEVEKLLGEFPSGFNPRSGNDVRSYMEAHGCTDWPMTPHRDPAKRQPSMVESWLENHEAGKKVIKVRKFTTLKSTFVQPMIETHLFNGRVHTEFNQLRGDEYGTVTGRLSSSNPNLQAVSKHNEEMGRLHRSIFVPDVGRIWGSCDYSQMEPRLLAYYSRCRVLLDGYNADPPIDAHTSVSMAANRNWPNMTPAERKHYRDDRGKRINQTIVTGGGKNVLVNKYKIPADEVDKVWRDYFRAMPEIRVLQERASKVFRTRGYVLSLLKRRARLQDRGKDYTAVNRLLQCGNADCIKLKMVEVDDYLASEGRPLDLLNNIHDDLSFQFPEEHRRHYKRCQQIMTSFGPNDIIKLDVPITVDAGEGKNWSEATYGPEK